MENLAKRLGEWWMRRLFVCMLLLAVGCRAQAPGPVSAELNRKIEKQIRATFSLPPMVDVTLSNRRPSTEFPGYSIITAKISYGDKAQEHELLLSKDEKALFSMAKMDLTRDPQAETMAKIDLKGRPVRGNRDAKVVVVVYDDFQCPYCSRMHQALVDVLRSYGDRIKVVYKDFPLVEIHPWAERAAIDSGCLAAQSDGAYWDFADYVHLNPQQIQGEQRSADGQRAEVDRITMDMGKRHGADPAALKSCIASQSPTALKASMQEAEGLGVEATPALFIDGTKLEGFVPESELRVILNKELQAAGIDLPKVAPGQ